MAQRAWAKAWAGVASAALAGLALQLLPAAGPARAQPTAEQQSALRSNCRSDFMSNCSGVQPGGAEALQCLQKNVAKLSPGCQGAVNALSPRGAPSQATAAPAPAPTAAPSAAPMPAAAPVAAPVTGPAAKPRAPQPARTATAQPPAAAPGRPAPAPASPAAAMPTPQQQSAIRFTCQRDFMTNCRGVTPGGADALACLQRNAARLSPDCRTSLAAVADGAPATTAAAEPAPAPRVGPPGPVGPLRRALRERMMNQ